MKKIVLMGILGCFLTITPAHALVYTFDSVNDEASVGDFFVGGSNIHSGTGINYEVLKFGTKIQPSLQNTAFDGSSASGIIANDQAPHGDVKVGDLWSELNTNGFTTAKTLIFGFDVNEAGSNAMTISALKIVIYDGLTPYEYKLGSNSIVVNEYNGNGSSQSELFFEIALPFDFMQKYNAASLDEFYIEATHNNETGGFEEYFLAKSGSVVTTPEPASLVLLGAGLVGAFYRRKK